MKSKILIILAVIIGLLVLFFFPEPETNFLWYSLTAVFFIILILIMWKKGEKET